MLCQLLGCSVDLTQVALDKQCGFGNDESIGTSSTRMTISAPPMSSELS